MLWRGRHNSNLVPLTRNRPDQQSQPTHCNSDAAETRANALGAPVALEASRTRPAHRIRLALQGREEVHSSSATPLLCPGPPPIAVKLTSEPNQTSRSQNPRILLRQDRIALPRLLHLSRRRRQPQQAIHPTVTLPHHHHSIPAPPTTTITTSILHRHEQPATKPRHTGPSNNTRSRRRSNRRRNHPPDSLGAAQAARGPARLAPPRPFRHAGLPLLGAPGDPRRRVGDVLPRTVAPAPGGGAGSPRRRRQREWQ